MVRSQGRFALTLFLFVACAVAGCSKKETKKPVTGKDSKAVTKPAFVVPTNVLMYTGTDAPEKTLGDLFAIAQKVTPMTPDPRAMIPPLIQGVFRMSSPAAIDLKKPLRFVLFDPKGLGRDPSALVVAAARREGVEGA